MRRDWYWAGWHVIRRECLTAQWGCLLWNLDHSGLARGWTLDVWVGRTLWTFRRVVEWE